MQDFATFCCLCFHPTPPHPLQWEFIEGPDLLECLNRHGAALPEPEAAFYFAQLLRGLLFMHQTGFAHRDLKPENCVLEERTRVLKVGCRIM
jgi:serine/threonine protein kinase